MNNIFLIDSVKNFENWNISQHSESTVITFDYNSHKELEKMGICHDISDSYLSTEELQTIQDSSYKFSKWFENNNFDQYLEYEGVKIGKLVYTELFVFLLPFLKNFFEIKKICQKYNNTLFHVSPELGKIVKQFSSNIEEDLQSNKTEFLFDTIVLQNAFLKIKISKENFNRLKIFLDKITKIFFSAKNQSNFDVLLIEFNTIMYSDFFKSLNKSGLKTLFYGLKRPAIWNKNSFSVMQQSKCKIAVYSDFLSEEIETYSKRDTQKLLEDLDNLLKNDVKLKEFFSLFDTEFWYALKPVFKNLCKKYIKDIVTEVYVTRKILQKYHPKIIIVLSESSKTDQIVISQAKTLGIPFYLLQHGLGYDTPKGHFWNQFTGSLPVESQKFLVWGNAMLNYAKAYDIPLSKVSVVGSVAHESIFSHKLQNLKNDYILLAIEGPRHTNIFDYTVQIHKEYENILKKIFEIVHKSNKKLLIKFHPNEPEINKTSIEHLLNPSVKIIKQGQITSYLQNCELLLTMSITTTILDAHVLKKPVLRIAFREWLGKPDMHRKTSSIVTSIEDFELNFHKILNDKEFRQQIISNGKEFVDDCLSFPTTASAQLSNTVKDFLNQSKS